MSALVLDNERRKKVSDELDMSFARIRALRQIARRATPMGELAQALSVDPPYLTLIVDDLEARGLVERREHPTDRRTKVVGATERGYALATRADEILDEPPDALLNLSNDELDTLERILSKLKHAHQF
jgi:DNA-binding MarR family transcriptional regulator